MSILIRNGRLVTASETFVSDILIDGEKISEIGANLESRADNTVDAIISPNSICLPQ